MRLLRRAGVGLADIGQFLAEPSADAVDGWKRSLTAETLSRHQALAEVRCRLGDGPERTRGATAIEIRAVRDLADLRAAFDLAGAQLAEPIGSGDHRIDDLVERFAADQPLMGTVGGNVVGGALGFRNDNGAVTLRIIGVIPAFRHRGIGRRLVERVEAEARRLGGHSVALGTDEAVGFWYHLGYTPNLLFQWVYDADLVQRPMRCSTGRSRACTSGGHRSTAFLSCSSSSMSLASICATRSGRRSPGATSAS